MLVWSYYATQRFANMSRLGFRSHFLVKPLKILLNVQTFNKPPSPSLLILAVELNPFSTGAYHHKTKKSS
jgi:hypothetical protein